MTHLSKIAFATGIVYENRLSPIDALFNAFENKISHFYINTSMHKISNTEIKKLIKLKNKYNLNSILHSSWRNEISSFDSSIRFDACQSIIDEINLAYQLSSPIIIHGTSDSNNLQNDVLYSNYYISFIDSFKTIYNIAKSKNVQIWLENLPCNEAAFFTSNKDYKLIFDEFDDVKFIFDLGHGNIDNNPLRTFELFNDKIVALSFSDNNGLRDTHWQLGKGTIDFKNLIKMIQFFKWRGIVVFDIHIEQFQSEILFLNNLIYN